MYTYQKTGMTNRLRKNTKEMTFGKNHKMMRNRDNIIAALQVKGKTTISLSQPLSIECEVCTETIYSIEFDVVELKVSQVKIEKNCHNCKLLYFYQGKRRYNITSVSDEDTKSLLKIINSSN